VWLIGLNRARLRKQIDYMCWEIDPVVRYQVVVNGWIRRDEMACYNCRRSWTQRLNGKYGFSADQDISVRYTWTREHLLILWEVGDESLRGGATCLWRALHPTLK
jgi:hypothetical protein